MKVSDQKIVNNLSIEQLDILIDHLEQAKANFNDPTGIFEVAQVGFEATLKNGEIRSVTLDELKQLRRDKLK